MTLKDLQRVQEIGAELLFLVDDICRKNQIDYYLMYGTLLGCVRHGESIPWDNDVDIAMTRDNYLRFIDVCRKDSKLKDYSVMLMDNGNGKFISELKIGKKNTTFCMPGTEKLDIMNHVHLDVFVLESAKMISEKQIVRRMKCWSILKIVSLNKGEKDSLKVMINKSSKRWKWIYRWSLDFFHVIRGIIGAENIEKIVFNLLVDKKKESDSFIVIGSPYYVIFKKEWFGHSEMVYSGRSVFVPSKYDEVLRTTYGNYMQLPPEDKRYPKYFKEWVFKENN